MLAALLLACAGSPRHDLGLPLAPCPPTPNCVSSLAEPGDAEHAIDPLPATGPADQTLQRAASLLSARPRTAVVQVDGAWLHATERSRLWGYVDDIELWADAEAGLLHIRSAARVGRTDLGVNRRRVEELRLAWTQP
jgi:uncharacterized protein (DUF1499 family)